MTIIIILAFGILLSSAVGKIVALKREIGDLETCIKSYGQDNLRLRIELNKATCLQSRSGRDVLDTEILYGK